MVSLRTSFSRFSLAALAAAVWLLVGGHPAHAAFPGLNGKIAFDRDTFTGSEATTRNVQARRAWGEAGPGLRGQSPETDQIWTINPDGSAAVNISNSTRLDAEGAWSADGSKVAFAAEDPATLSSFNSQIWVMNPDGSGQVNLTNDPTSNDFDPAWSPNGTQIVYTHQDATTKLFQIWVMNADGSGKHQLVDNAGAGDDDAVWSPDGTRIAFDRTDESGRQVYVVSASGSGATNVSNNGDEDSEPNWSPDGTRLAFAKIPGDSENGDSQIWVMNADGSSPHFITNPNTDADVPGAHFDDAPAFSPDGTQITYEREGGSAETVPFQFTVWVIGADSANAHQLSNPDPSSADFFPDWQPVGAPASTAALPAACTSTASVVVHAADATHFISPLNVHFRVDGGAEQVVAADASGNVTVPVSNGTHTVEYWAGDGAGYQEAAHHTGTVTVDTVHQCAPQVGVAGVRRACVAKTFRIRVHVSSAGGAPKSVKVFLGKKRVLSTKKTSFTLKINPKKLGHHTRLRIVTTGSNGKVTTLSRTIARCAVKKPRHRSAPRFTG